jgi:adenylate cyclase
MASFLRNHGGNLLGLGVVLCCSIFMSTSVWGVHITDTFFDPIRTTDQRSETVIVGIDDASLQALGAWPWDRSVFAKLEDVLDEAHARTIAYDVLFLEPRSGDGLFKESLSRSSVPTFLAAKREGDAYIESYLTGSSTKTFSALVNVDPDTDGKVRQYAQGFSRNGKCVNSISYSSFLVFTFKDHGRCGNNLNLFRYSTNITTYSLIDVIKGTVPKEKLMGKAIFIGSTSLDLEDHFVSLTGNKVPGVYVHASMFTSLLNNVNDKRSGGFETGLILIGTTLITFLLLYQLTRIVPQVLGIITLLILATVASAVTFMYGKVLPAPWMLESIIVTSVYLVLIRFIKERDKNKQIELLFSKYVHKDVLRELMGSAAPLRLGGEKRNVTVLFSDLRGFTTLSEELSAEELTSTLNAYFSAMTPHILEEKGTIDKFIGDAIMAFWNAPLTIPDHATHALNAALRMQNSLTTFNEANKTALEMGIGIHQGEVIVGNVGGEDRVNYTILGDTVNLTSRLEGLTKKYGVKILVTEAVFSVVKDTSYVFRLIDVITVKGKSVPTKIYEVRSFKDWDSGLIEAYEKAFEFYQKGLWDAAVELLSKFPQDEPSSVMMRRIPSLKENKTWDGIWRFDEK